MHPLHSARVYRGVSSEDFFRQYRTACKSSSVVPANTRTHRRRHRFAKVFHFHLFEFAGAEDRILKDDFVAERFSDLRNAERNLHPVRLNDIFKIDEDALTGFRAQVYDGRVAFDGAEMRFKHQIEFAHGGIEIGRAHV